MHTTVWAAITRGKDVSYSADYGLTLDLDGRMSMVDGFDQCGSYLSCRKYPGPYVTAVMMLRDHIFT